MDVVLGRIERHGDLFARRAEDEAVARCGACGRCDEARRACRGARRVLPRAGRAGRRRALSTRPSMRTGTGASTSSRRGYEGRRNGLHGAGPGGGRARVVTCVFPSDRIVASLEPGTLLFSEHPMDFADVPGFGPLSHESFETPAGAGVRLLPRARAAGHASRGVAVAALRRRGGARAARGVPAYPAARASDGREPRARRRRTPTIARAARSAAGMA